MARFDTWESYFYPETYSPATGNGTLRNLFEERDDAVLRVLEYGSTAQRQRELNADPRLVVHTFDAAHVRAIHGHLLGDVYEWAGQYRTVNISKGPGRAFGDVKTGEVDRYLADVHRLVEDTEWGQLGREEFGEHAAQVFAYLNQAHPFREGNGRTSKVFMEHVAGRSGFVLDFERVTPFEWNQAAALSRPDLYTYEPVPDSLVPVFRHIAVERTSTTTTGVDVASQARSPLSASYPKPATEAARQDPQRAAGAPRVAGPYLPGRGQGTGRGEGR